MGLSPIDTPFDLTMRFSARTAVAAIERRIEAAPAAGTAWGASEHARAAAADPVVLVPGYGATASSWSAVRRGLERDGFRVHVFEPRGTGLGDIRPLARDLDGFVDGVLAASDGAAAVQVVGHSKGGLVAQEWVRGALAAGAPTRASALVTLGTPNHGLRPTSETNPVLAAALAWGGPSSAAIVQTERGPFVDAIRAAGIERQVPTTSIHATGSDGLVAEASAHIDAALNVAVGSSRTHPDHMGLLTDAAAYDAIRGALLPRS